MPVQAIFGLYRGKWVKQPFERVNAKELYQVSDRPVWAPSRRSRLHLRVPQAILSQTRPTPTGYIWKWGKYKVLVLLADDHALVREGLKHSLTDLDSDLEFIEAATADEVVDRLSSHPTIELALLDLVMPGNTGFELIAHVCNTYPNLPVTILSGSNDPTQMRKALDIGASGFITKSASAAVMLSALRLVMAGGIYVPPEMVRPNSATAETISDPDPRLPLGIGRGAQLDALTARQHEVLERLENGKSNKQIARELNLSENTVKIHVGRILRALGVSNRTQAAVFARAKGKKGASSS